MIRKELFLLVILMFSVHLSSASMNITIFSENEHINKITSLSTSTNFSLNNSQITLLPYDNYFIDVYPDYKTLSNETIMNNFKLFTDDRYRFIGIGLVFMLIIFAYMVIRRIG